MPKLSLWEELSAIRDRLIQVGVGEEMSWA
jgi:hypothetical protein